MIGEVGIEIRWMLASTETPCYIYVTKCLPDTKNKENPKPNCFKEYSQAKWDLSWTHCDTCMYGQAV